LIFSDFFIFFFTIFAQSSVDPAISRNRPPRTDRNEIDLIGVINISDDAYVHRERDM